MILLVSLLIIIFMGLYYDFIFNNPSLNVVEIPVEAVKSNKCIFGLFTEQFKLTNSSYVYYPNQFKPVNIRSPQNLESFSLLEYIRQEQDVMLKHYIAVALDNLGTLHKLSN
jgi:hypothetical protein